MTSSNENIEEQYAKFNKYYDEHQELWTRATKSFEVLIANIISPLIRSEDIESAVVTSRIKARDECISKYKRKYCKKDTESMVNDPSDEHPIETHLTDIIGIRIVCYYESEIPKIAKKMRENFEVVSETNKSAQQEERNTFGYKGIHFDLKLGSNRTELVEYTDYREIQFEVQIRTIIQDAWSNLDHKIQYKKSIPPELGLGRRINALAALFEIADREFESVHNIAKKAVAQFHEKHLSNETSNTTSSKKEEKTLSPFNAFACLNILRNMYPRYPFEDNSVYDFSKEILDCKPDANVNVDEVITALDTHRARVEEYNQHVRGRGKNLNPYTEVRHMLYLSDKVNFKPLLDTYQIEQFDNWGNGMK